MERQRNKQACANCRKHKKRCSGSWPCAYCRRMHKDCVFRVARSSASVFRHRFSNTYSVVVSKHERLHSSVPTGDNGDLSMSEQWERARNPQTSRRRCPSCQKVSSGARHAIHTCSESEKVREEFTEQDPAGNLVDPVSPYSWLRKARVRLGHVTKMFENRATGDTSQASSIFTYGDSAPTLVRQVTPERSLSSVSFADASHLLNLFFERALVTYRFLHEPTVKEWLRCTSEGQGQSLRNTQRAIVFTAVSHGMLYLTSEERSQLRLDRETWPSSEELLQQGMQSLDAERGVPALESIQARLCQVHHLLSSSRPNQAWYIFGQVVQLTFALGIHRNRKTPQRMSVLDRELQRRVFWCVYTTDKYLSIALGRPPLIYDDQTSQMFPEEINDEDLDKETASLGNHGDCLTSATICHARLARIIARGISEYSETCGQSMVGATSQNRASLEDWRRHLPPYLSGQVHPSTLVPSFRRQATVINTFYLNAVILINRPFLLHHFSDDPEAEEIQSSVQVCLDASKELAEQMIRFAVEGQRTQVYWFTQSITFTAISILYLHLLRTLQKRGSLDGEGSELLKLAQNAQESLKKASQDNAPSLRYDVVLNELREEVQRQTVGTDDASPGDQGTVEACHSGEGAEDIGAVEQNWPTGTDKWQEGNLKAVSDLFWPLFDSLSAGNHVDL